MSLDAVPSPSSTGDSSGSLVGQRLGVVGTGAMAEAIIGGLLRQGRIEPAHVVCSHPRPARRAELSTRWGVQTTESNRQAAQLADLLLIAVKPQVLRRVTHDLAGHIRPETLVISIIAGAGSRVLGEELGHPAVVRAMPNTPAQIGSGITVWYATPEVDGRGRDRTRELLSSLGEELEVEDEEQVAMATAVSGTGPTYTFLFIESLIDAAVHLGFPRHLARRLVVATVAGSAEFAAQSQKHVSELRDMVTSPGGTSAEALAALERGRFRTVLGDAVWAAYRRTRQLESALEEGHRPGPGGPDPGLSPR